MIEAIIFDFDGVITQSNRIRRQTYFDILKHMPNSKEALNEAMEEDLKRGRYGIIEAALQKLEKKGSVQIQDLKKETEKYVEEYNEITEEGVCASPEVPGAKNALEILYKKYPLFVVTGTLQKSIDIVIRNRGLIKYFKAIYGSFRYKIDGLELLAKEHKICPKNSVFVGDGREDYECAKYHCMPFVAVLNETNDFEKRKDIKWKLKDLKNLPEVIEEMNNQK